MIFIGNVIKATSFFSAHTNNPLCFILKQLCSHVNGDPFHAAAFQTGGVVGPKPDQRSALPTL
jgi:hypothetical protein